MNSPQALPERDALDPTAFEDDGGYVGLVTRIVSWAVDELAINLVAIFTGVGVALVVAIFPITKNLKPLFIVIGGVVYVLWTAAYFVGCWSTTGQTLGSRFMQVRLVMPDGGRVKPARALVRWIGMNLAMVPLPWGFVPIPFRRLGFPDWLAHTRVIEAHQLSMAQAGQQRMRARRAPLATATLPPPRTEQTDGP
jgi:uncharacterized RDD family membrane protein YckC